MEQVELSEDQKILNKCMRIFNWGERTSKIIGVWAPTPNHYLFNLTFVYFTIFILLEYVDFYYALHDFDKMIDNLTESLVFSIIYVRMLCLRLYDNKLKEVITESLKDFRTDAFVNSKEVEIFVSHINTGIFYAKVIITFTVMSQTFWFLGPLLSSSSPPDNGTLYPDNQTNFPVMPYHVHVFHEIKSSKTWALTYASLFPFLVINECATVSTNVFLISTVYQIAGKLAVLTERINSMRISDKLFKIQLEGIIVEHIKLLKMGTYVKESYSAPLLVYLVNTQICLCITSYQILIAIIKGTDAFLMKYCVYMLTIYFIMTIICTISETLNSASNQVCEAYWNCKWYKMSHGHATNIAILLLRSQKPLSLRAGKFKTFGYATLTEVTQKSMGYLSVLRNFVVVED